MPLPTSQQHTNSIGMPLVRIAPGSFTMGSSDAEEYEDAFDERPAHRVTISRPFYMGACEVTNAQYEQFDPAHRQLRGMLGFSSEDDEAVVFVSWHEASAFCEWLSEKEGLPYRLPTEAEWEYACRAGTTTRYNTGDDLPVDYHKHQQVEWSPKAVPLHVGATPANAWGLHDMHGNVEEWCQDWYGPYLPGDQTDPVGYASGDFKVTRGGSHTTELVYLRSANRLATLPEDKHWVIGFRIVLGELPATEPLPVPEPPLWARDVSTLRHDWQGGPDPQTPYFKGPRRYVNLPPDSGQPMFGHNHCPAIVSCPNGDLLAIWYSCINEPGRELGILASRLRLGAEEWEPASVFWNTPDRNDHASALWFDGEDTLYHFNGLSTDATWGKLALIMRTSTDSGATWTSARIINPEHGLRNMPIESVFRTSRGEIILPCDAVTGGEGGSAIHVSADGGETWTDPGAGQPQPTFEKGTTGAWIAGIHAGVLELKDGRLMALGRGDTIDGRMPRSVSADGGRTWTYSAGPFPPIGGGQRPALLRLGEGPLFLASFAEGLEFTDATGETHTRSGLFAALSYDEGETWPVRKLITDSAPEHAVEGSGGQLFMMSPRQAESRGYLSVCQAPDGVIHLISSRQHYALNLKWIETPPSPDAPGPVHPVG